MCGADPGFAFNQAVVALNEVTRLEEIRSDSSPENWERLLAGLGTVVVSTARLTDTVGAHLARATEQASPNDDAGPDDAGLDDEDPDALLAAAAESVSRISTQLTEAAQTIATARDQVALLRPRTKRSGGAADEGPG